MVSVIVFEFQEQNINCPIKAVWLQSRFTVKIPEKPVIGI